jgi:CRISPR-associated exonuclease Cas4
LKNVRPTYHSEIAQVRIIEGQNNFPISWLNTQGYCEYCIYLENVKGILAAPTMAMKKGSKVHRGLEDEFKKDAIPTTMEEMMETSKTAEILSRELYVESASYGIRGLIDEIWMTPDEFIIIDDKPGKIAYPSQINQVFGYCLAFKDRYDDGRRIVASLRQSTTGDVFWQQYFDKEAENHIKDIVNHVHQALLFNEDFISTKNPNKCRSCRFNLKCDRRAEP